MKTGQGYHMFIGHDHNAAVDIIGEKVGDEGGLAPCRSSLGEHFLGKFWCCFLPVLKTKRAESL